MAYSHEERMQAIRLLAETVESDEDTPRWEDVSRETGVSPRSLRKWWEKRDRYQNVEVFEAPRKVTPDPDEQMLDPLSAGASTFYAWMFSQIGGDLEFAMQRGAATGLPAMRRMQVEMYEAVRSALAEERAKGGGLSAEEQEARLRELVQALPPKQAVVVVEELRRRGIA